MDIIQIRFLKFATHTCHAISCIEKYLINASDVFLF